MDDTDQLQVAKGPDSECIQTVITINNFQVHTCNLGYLTGIVEVFIGQKAYLKKVLMKLELQGL